MLDQLPKPTQPGCVLDYAGILAVLPHRYPFLYVDGVTLIEPGVRAEGWKNTSFGEPYFTGHFPSEPVMPGVLQIEALAQLCCVLMAVSFDDLRDKRPAFLGIDTARFRKAVRPGDRLDMTVELKQRRRNTASLSGRIVVAGAVACEADILAAMV